MRNIFKVNTFNNNNHLLENGISNIPNTIYKTTFPIGHSINGPTTIKAAYLIISQNILRLGLLYANYINVAIYLDKPVRTRQYIKKMRNFDIQKRIDSS